MFVCSVISYLFVRKCTILKTPTHLVNLSMFLIPVLLFLPWSFVKGVSLALTPYQLIIVVITAIAFSYFGNIFSLKSIERAPNPGYPLILSKSYVVFTSIVSIWVFQSPLSFKSGVGIASIVLFSALIMINKKQTKDKATSDWLLYALGAFFCWGMLALSSKYLLNLGVPVLARLVYIMGIVSVFISSETFNKRVGIVVTKQQLMLLFATGIASAGFNYFMQEAFVTAPNVGFVNAINAASISGVTLLAAWIYKDELTLQKIVGVIGVTVGLVFLMLT